MTGLLFFRILMSYPFVGLILIVSWHNRCVWCSSIFFLTADMLLACARHKVRAIIISRRVLICSDGYIYFLLSCCDTCLLVRVVTDKITFVLFCRIINFFLRNKTGSFTFELSVFYIAFFIQGCRRYQHIQSDGIVTILSVDLAMECFALILMGILPGITVSVFSSSSSPILLTHDQIQKTLPIRIHMLTIIGR